MKHAHTDSSKFYCPFCEERTEFVVPVKTDPTSSAGMRILVKNHAQAAKLSLTIDPEGDAECVNCGGEMSGSELSCIEPQHVALAS